MTRPRSDPRSGASPHPEPDASALRRELYRPGADRDTVLAYLAAAEAERPNEPDGADQDAAGVPGPDLEATAGAEHKAPAPPPEAGPGQRRRRWRAVALTAAVAVAVPAVGIALLPRPAPPRAPRPTATSSPIPVAPTTITGLRGATTVLVALPFRTFRVRVRLHCARPGPYDWRAAGEDAQTQQFVPVMSHTGTGCSPSASYIGPLPGDVEALRFAVIVDGPYTLTVEPL